MKGITQLALAASLVAGTQATHQHHRHHHARRVIENLEKRTPDVVTAFVKGPVVAVYELDGKVVDEGKAKAGLAEGLYSVVGETTPTFTPPPPPPVTTTSVKPTSSSTSSAAQFFEQKASPSPEPKSSAPAPVSSSPSVGSGSGSGSGATGLDADFPSGEIDCSSLPSQYGAQAVPWLGLDGWLSFQQPDDKKWIPGVLISTIHQPTSGGCPKNSFCSYACPNGYQKTQWPTSSQGATGQSIGGLWCNEKGKLELTRPEYPKLCEKGAGGVFVQNKLDGVSNICQTNYPGDEKMSIATETKPGGKYELLNPDAKTSYWWKNSPTSAQFYLNNEGVDVENACTWKSSKYPDSAGNWSPANLGVGKDIHGITYISIFWNKPTSNAKLDYNVEITGDVTAPCALKGGQFTGGGNGCTTAISKAGGTVTIVFSK
ncbi:hypothetical protein RB595_000913 [Gaeumannomyces hyphopodioides]